MRHAKNHAFLLFYNSKFDSNWLVEPIFRFAENMYYYKYVQATIFKNGLKLFIDNTFGLFYNVKTK